MLTKELEFLGKENERNKVEEKSEHIFTKANEFIK